MGEFGQPKVENLHSFIFRDEQILWLQIAVYDSARVQIFERIRDRECDGDGPGGIEPSFLRQDRAQETSLNPLRDHVYAAAIFVTQNLQDTRMVHLPADLGLAGEAIVEDHVALGFGMGHFNGNDLPAFGIDGAKNGGQSASSHSVTARESGASRPSLCR